MPGIRERAGLFRGLPPPKSQALVSGRCTEQAVVVGVQLAGQWFTDLPRLGTGFDSAADRAAGGHPGVGRRDCCIDAA